MIKSFQWVLYKVREVNASFVAKGILLYQPVQPKHDMCLAFLILERDFLDKNFQMLERLGVLPRIIIRTEY